MNISKAAELTISVMMGTKIIFAVIKKDKWNTLIKVTNSNISKVSTGL